jgi:hypothetical protein
MNSFKFTAPIIITFIWIGFVCAISFMEAPVKFTAPHLNLQVGVEVGRQVFKALNHVEIVFGMLSLVLLVMNSYNRTIAIMLGIAILLLLLQTLWLLPQLHHRVQIIIEGGKPQPSVLHIIYIITDGLKVIILFFLGFFQFSQFKRNLIN